MADPIDAKEANKALYISGAVILLVVIGLFTNGFGLFSNTEENNNGNGEFVRLEIGDAPVLGNRSAPVTIYEFSDFSCPFCAAAAGYNEEVMGSLRRNDPLWEPTLPQLKEEYVDTGKVKIVFKYFPGHGTGNAAHLVGWCLNEQDLFWQFHDEAFKDQESTGNLNAMKDLAEQVGADMDVLQECLNTNNYSQLFQKDRQMGQSNGVRGTPAFFVNGKLVSGAIPYSQMKAMVEEELR